MKNLKHTIFSAVVNKFFAASSAANVSFKRGAMFKTDLICKKHHGLTASFGCEGDRDAPIAFIDGSYLLRDRADTLINFGFSSKKLEGKIKWYNSEGWLPCLVSEFNYSTLRYKIENFANDAVIDGNRFEIAYTRLTVTNVSSARAALPKKPRLLVPLSEDAKKQHIESGETITMDYAVCADRFGCKYSFPDDSKTAAAGGFDENYRRMRDYWMHRTQPLAQITELPDRRLIDAYKAGFVYTQIVKDGDELHVGENGYDRVFDHDVIGIMVSLLTVGDFTGFKDYAKHILKNVQYPDARWKYAWAFAVYLMRTDDRSYIREIFGEIRENTHAIESDRIEDGKGIMKRTNAIDTNGFWTIDNWSALTGLAAYRYICMALSETQEAKWASEQYDSLLGECDKKLRETLNKYSIDYIPISMEEPNETCPRSDSRDANWASMFLFGRWAWDAYLFGAEQHGVMLELIDKTYSHGFERRKSVSDTISNFGGYPHGYFSSSYNAGYGSAALRGEEYRDIGIKAYQFMIEHSQSGPFAWWEGIGYPDDASPWNIPHASCGGGSCQHIWGQSVATKVLFDSLISVKADGTLIVGRGVPQEWIKDGNVIEIRNFPILHGKRVNLRMDFVGKTALATVYGDTDGLTIDTQLCDSEIKVEVKLISDKQL